MPNVPAIPPRSASFRRRPPSALLAGAAAAVWSAMAPAQTWNLDANGDWNVNGNWSPATFPNAVDATATLGNVITANRTITLGQTITVGTLAIDDNNNYQIAGAAGDLLVFDVSAGDAALTVTNVNGNGAHTIAAPVQLNDTLVVTQGSTGATTFLGAVSGAGGITKEGTGTLSFTGTAKTYTGATRINNGTLNYGVANAISGASQVFIGDGVGGAGSALLTINQTMGTAAALDVTIASDGRLVQGNNRIVRLSALSGAGEVVLNAPVPQLFEITGTGADTTYGGVISGGAASASTDPGGGSRLTKSGASTLTLDGNNTHVSRIFISGGALRAASNAALGAAGANSATYVSGAGALELANNVTIAERIFINGPGNGGAGAIRNFAGDNTITGDVTVGWSGGSVAAADAAIGSEAGTTLTISGNVDGARALGKVGAGTLVLSGANTWSGGTTVADGILRLGAAGGLPDGTVLTVNGGTLDLNNFSKTVNDLSGSGGAIALGSGTLTVDQTAAGAFAGSITGSGALVKDGAQTLTLTGANTYAGGTTVNAGTLQGNSTSLQGDIVNDAAVAFDQAADGAYAGAISGTGTLTKSGAGNLTLSGASTHAGSTALNAGTLTVQGSLASAVNVAAGATLAGTGTVGGDVTTVAGAIVAPGNPGGTLNVGGNYSHAAGAGYRVRADASGAASRMNVAGTATLAGGAVDVQAQPGSYAGSTTYTILNATGGVTGTFDGVTSSLAFLTPSLAYDPNNVLLTLTRTDASFADAALTPNQRAVARALDGAAGAGAGGDMAAVLTAVTGLSAPEARAAFDALGGLMHTLLPTIGVTDANLLNASVASRLRRPAFQPGPVALAMPAGVAADAAPVYAGTAGTAPGAARRGAWVNGYGIRGDIDGDANSGDYDYRVSAIVLGADAEVAEGWIAGVTASYSDWRVTNDRRGDSADVKAYRAGAYSRYEDGPLRVDGLLSYGSLDYETRRPIVFGGLARVAAADYDGRQLAAYLDAGYRLGASGSGVEPFVAFQWVRERQDGFAEAGAAAAGLVVAGRTVESTRGLVGLRADRGFRFQDGEGVVELRAAYAREFSSVPTINALLAGDPSLTRIGIVSEAGDRDVFLAGAGVSLAPRRNLTLFADVNGEFRGDASALALIAGLRYAW